MRPFPNLAAAPRRARRTEVERLAFDHPGPRANGWATRQPPQTPASPLPPVAEEPAASPYSAGGTAASGYSPFTHDAAATMRAAAAESAYDAHVAAALNGSLDSELVPLTHWVSVAAVPSDGCKRLPGGARALAVEVALARGEMPSDKLVSSVGHALAAGRPAKARSHTEATAHLWMPCSTLCAPTRPTLPLRTVVKLPSPFLIP